MEWNEDGEAIVHHGVGVDEPSWDQRQQTNCSHPLSIPVLCRGECLDSLTGGCNRWRRQVLYYRHAPRMPPSPPPSSSQPHSTHVPRVEWHCKLTEVICRELKTGWCNSPHSCTLQGKRAIRSRVRDLHTLLYRRSTYSQTHAAQEEMHRTCLLPR